MPTLREAGEDEVLPLTMLVAISHIDSQATDNPFASGARPVPTGSATKVPSKRRSIASSRSVGAKYYANCSAARAAGAGPIRRGDPGYSRKLDCDNDGIGCE